MLAREPRYNIAVTRYIGDFYMLDPVKLGEVVVEQTLK